MKKNVQNVNSFIAVKNKLNLLNLSTFILNHVIIVEKNNFLF